MPLFLENLDDSTRIQMRAEINRDIENLQTYISPRLNEEGKRRWTEFLLKAADSGNDVGLAEDIQTHLLLNEFETRRGRNGTTINARVPITAGHTLAEGEFNRFYVRGLCLRAIADGIARLEVYRAKEVATPRPESHDKIGSFYEPNVLLNDVRAHIGVDTALGMPQGPNSGLSLRIPHFV